MRIPEVQAEMLTTAGTLADETLAGKLRYWVQELYRRPAQHRASSQKQIPRSVRRPLVLAYKAAHPEASYLEIAVALGITNTGRVSEDLTGYRE